MRKQISLLFIALFFAYLTSSITVTGNSNHLRLSQTNTANQCETVTQSVTIKAVPSIKFDTDKITVDRGACVALTFTNDDTITHDFSIDGGKGFDAVFVSLAAGESATVNIQIPDEDVTVAFYCSVPGHREAGMEGDFQVGAGSSDSGDSPGFGLYLAFAGFLALAAVMKTVRQN